MWTSEQKLSKGTKILSSIINQPGLIDLHCILYTTPPKHAFCCVQATFTKREYILDTKDIPTHLKQLHSQRVYFLIRGN